MTKKLLLLIAFVSISLASFAQSGVLKGKVIDKANGETVPFAAVTLLKGGAVVAAVQTDLDGEYTIKPIPPGEYDVKATYVGYSPAQVSKVKINAEKTTYVDLNVSQGMELAAVEITDYKVPLIDPNASSISTVGKAEFNQMATKNLGAVASQTAGVFQADENKGINVRGSRGSDQGGESSTDVYIDGVRTRGSNKVPQRGVEQVSVITSGVPAQYGDATGGVISVTTSGPQSELHGGVEAISSQITDAYGLELNRSNLF